MIANKNKTFILGIDGATFDIILPLIERGKLPNMAKIIKNGASGSLKSTIPSLSAPAWVSFMTGCDPGNYGTYHFRKINISEYQNILSQELINSSAFSGATFFDYLGKLGYKVGVMTVPVTYPPWKVNGFMVAGYPCPDPHDNPNFTFPAELGRELPENLNWTEVENSENIPKGELRGAGDPQNILEGGLSMMSRRVDYALKMMKKFDSDVTVLVLGAIDRAQHKLWKYHDPKHVLHKPGNDFKSYIEQLYCHADSLLGKIIADIGPKAQLFIVSDHGFGPKQGCYFHINAWLNKMGYLKTGWLPKLVNNPFTNILKRLLTKLVLKRTLGTQKKAQMAKKRFETGAIKFDKTLAYRFPIDEKTEGLVINLQGRQKSGRVAKAEYEAIRTKLMAELTKLCDPRNAESIVKNCYKREDIYSGKKCAEAPDIIISLAEGYYTGARPSGVFVTDIPGIHLNEISGHHRSQGIFMAHGPHIAPGKIIDKAGIMDVAPTIIYALGEKIPKYITGKPLLSVFSPEYAKAAPEYVDFDFKTGTENVVLSSEEEETMKNSLKELGYL